MHMTLTGMRSAVSHSAALPCCGMHARAMDSVCVCVCVCVCVTRRVQAVYNSACVVVQKFNLKCLWHWHQLPVPVATLALALPHSGRQPQGGSVAEHVCNCRCQVQCHWLAARLYRMPVTRRRVGSQWRDAMSVIKKHPLPMWHTPCLSESVTGTVPPVVTPPAPPGPLAP